MLFPPQANPKNIINKLGAKSSKEKREAQIAAIKLLEETNIIRRWNYSLDSRIEYLQQEILARPNTPNDFDVVMDSVKPEEFIDIEPREIKADAFTLVKTTREGLLQLLERAPAIIRRQAKIESVHGQIAGSLLWYIYHMVHGKFPNPSLTKAREICIAHYPKRFNNGRGRPAKNSTRLVHSYAEGTLKNTWRDFGSVAHLWAAYLAMNKDIICPTDRPLENINISKFICYAEYFSEFATNYIIPGSQKKSVLNKNTLIELPVEVSGDMTHLGEHLINAGVKQYMAEYFNKTSPA